MAKLKWTVEFSVDESWIADGFTITKERALQMLENSLQFAYSNSELGARIVSKPADSKIAKLQGFKSVAEFKRAGG